MRNGLSRRVALLAALALAPLGCAGGCGAKGGADAGVVEPTGPVPAPEGHLGDLFIAAPGATWGRARTAIGGAALFLPQSFGALVTTMVGVPVTVAAEIDDAVPVIGAGARQGAGVVQMTIGIHVKAGDRFVDQLTKGPEARFNATVDPLTHVTLLTDKAGTGSRAGLGVLGNYLLVASKPADLYAIGPYLVRTLAVAPARAAKDDVDVDIPEKALAGPFLERARELGKQTNAGGVSLVPFSGVVDAAVTLLGDSTGAKCALNLEGTLVHGRCAITPKAGGAGAKLVTDLAVGNAKPLLDMPDKTNAAILWRESLAMRTANAPKQAEALAGLLGADASAEDKAAISAALTAEAAARGDWQAIGATFNGTGPTAFVRVPASDPDALRKSIKQLVDLGNLASFKKAFSGLGLTLTTDKLVVENLAADVSRVRLGRETAKDPKGKKGPPADKKNPAPADKTPSMVDLLYFVDAGGLFAAAGFDPKDSLRAVAKSEPANLAAVPAFASLLTSVGDEAAVVVVADFLRIRSMTLGSTPPPTPTPLLIAGGRSPNADLWARLDVPSAVLQELVQEYLRRKSAP